MAEKRNFEIHLIVLPGYTEVNMLKRISSLIGLTLLLVAVSFGQKATPESELRAIYKELDAALKMLDANKVTKYYDANYTLESDGKKLSRAEAVDQWKSILGFMKSVSKLTTKIEKISGNDGVFTVEYSQTSSGKVQFPQSPVLPFTYSGKVTDTWVRGSDGKWLNMKSVEHLSDLKVNGESSKPPGD